MTKQFTRKRRQALLWLIGTLALIAPSRSQSAPPNATRPGDASLTVAVLNFANLGQGDPAWDWLGKGLADLTIGDLASQELKVVSREQMQEMIHELALKKQNHDPQAIARVLKAACCVHGTFTVDAGKAQLHASILDAATGRQLHTAAVSGPQADLLSLQKKLAAELADVLKGNKPGTIDPAKLPRWTESLSASQLLYQAIDLFDKGQYLDAWGLFRRALRQDPIYADALYWSGRMMYYVQEYHQARIDLEEFCIRHPKHQRVGDAVMEIINAAQLTASDGEEVLRVLRFAAELAPKAEIHNQFGATRSSNVGLYAAGLATQILLPQKRYREAFDFYAQQINGLPRDGQLYWVVWRELFKLRVQHLKTRGEVLDMPPRPSLAWVRGRLFRAGHLVRIDEDEVRELWMNGTRLRKPSIVGGLYAAGAYGALRVEDPMFQELVPVTSAQPTVELDFSSDPLTPRLYNHEHGTFPAILGFQGETFVQQYYTDPQHELIGFDLEVRHRHDPNRKFAVRLEGDVTTPYLPLNASGLIKRSVSLPFGTRALSCRLAFGELPAKAATETTPAAILSWRMTAKLRRRPADTGTLVLRSSGDLDFRARLDGQEVPVVERVRKLENVAAGKHTLHFRPVVWGQNPEQTKTFELAAGETLELTLRADVDPRRRGDAPSPWLTHQITSPYPEYRLGPGLGDLSGYQSYDVHFCEDRNGRWIVLWNMRRDLYVTVSSDQGRTWSPTTPLSVPVNSAHSERYPVLCQDAEGRYVLMFSSDRGLNHAHAVYVCWSEDLINFSAPVLLVNDSSVPYRSFRRADGMFLAYMLSPTSYDYVRDANGKQTLRRDPQPCSVSASLDLRHWSRPQPVWRFQNSVYVKLDILEDRGRFLAVTCPDLHLKPGQLQLQTSLLQFQTSPDGITFSAPQLIPSPFSRHQIMPLHLTSGKDTRGTYALMYSMSGRSEVFRFDGENTWKPAGSVPQLLNFGRGTSSTAFAPWGALALDDNDLCFFSLQYPNQLDIDSTYQAKPLFLNRYILNQKPRSPKDGQMPPTNVSVRIQKGPSPEPVEPSAALLRLSAPGQSRLSPLPVVDGPPVIAEPPTFEETQRKPNVR